MPRSTWLVVLLVLALPASAGAAAAKTVPCTGKVVKRNAQVKIVRQRVHSTSEHDHNAFTGHRFIGCALHARGHVLVEAGTNYLYENGKVQGWFSGSTVRFNLLAGRFLYARDSYASNSAQGEDGVVYDVASGKFRAVWGTGDLGEDEDRPLAWKLDADGVWAGIMTSGDDHLVVATKGLAKLATLDQAPANAIPSGSLTLTGSTVGWTNAGAPKSADLP